MIKDKNKKFRINFGPQHPAAHGVLRLVLDLDGDGYDEFPDFEVKNSKGEFRLDYDPSPDLNITFQTGYSWSKLQQVTGIGRYLADGYEYTYYQLRGRYKNWFAQIYLNEKYKVTNFGWPKSSYGKNYYQKARIKLTKG